jgi:hypothetical protein
MMTARCRLLLGSCCCCCRHGCGHSGAHLIGVRWCSCAWPSAAALKPLRTPPPPTRHTSCRPSSCLVLQRRSPPFSCGSLDITEYHQGHSPRLCLFVYAALHDFFFSAIHFEYMCTGRRLSARKRSRLIRPIWLRVCPCTITFFDMALI